MIRRKMRHELKYYIPIYEKYALRERVRRVMSLDHNSVTEDGYHIRSLYFDNVHESALHDKTNGILRRKKYRIRIYNKSDQVIKLERKSKMNHLVMKESARLTKDEYYSLLHGDIYVLHAKSAPLLRDFYFDLKNEHMKPAVVVDYIREAYTYPISDVRVTFDKQLSASVQSFDIFDPSLITREMIHGPQTILEVKYNQFLPDMISNLLQMPAHSRSAISKYVICKESRKVYSN